MLWMKLKQSIKGKLQWPYVCIDVCVCVWMDACICMYVYVSVWCICSHSLKYSFAALFVLPEILPVQFLKISIILIYDLNISMIYFHAMLSYRHENIDTEALINSLHTTTQGGTNKNKGNSNSTLATISYLPPPILLASGLTQEDEDLLKSMKFNNAKKRVYKVLPDSDEEEEEDKKKKENDVISLQQRGVGDNSGVVGPILDIKNVIQKQLQIQMDHSFASSSSSSSSLAASSTATLNDNLNTKFVLKKRIKPSENANTSSSSSSLLSNKGSDKVSIDYKKQKFDSKDSNHQVGSATTTVGVGVGGTTSVPIIIPSSTSSILNGLLPYGSDDSE